MKDSRLGTYGAIGIFSILLLKYLALLHVQEKFIIWVLLSGQSFSRLFPVFMVRTSVYAREDNSSKIKNATGKYSIPSLLFSLFTGVLFLFFLPWESYVFILPINVLVFIFLRAYVHKKSMVTRAMF